MIRKSSLVGDARGVGRRSVIWRLAVAAVAVVLGCRSLPAQTVVVVGAFAVPPGFSMIAFQMDKGDNTVGSIFGSGEVDGTAIFEYDSLSGAFSESVWQDGAWTDPTMKLLPGEGAFIYNPTWCTRMIWARGRRSR